MAGKLLALALPMAVVNFTSRIMIITELAVIGHACGVHALAAVSVSRIVINILQEPACFIVTNAATTLCADAQHNKTFVASTFAHATLVFGLLLTVPIGGLLLAVPSLLSLLALPSEIIAEAAAYTPACAISVFPALIHSSAVGFLRAQQKLPSTSIMCCLTALLNAALMIAFVPAHGVAGAALCTGAMRCFSIGSLASRHWSSFSEFGRCRLDFGGSKEDIRASVRSFVQLYRASLLPATLRLAVSQLLPVIALLQGCGGSVVAAIALAMVLLQLCSAGSTGIQQAHARTALHASARKMHAMAPTSHRFCVCYLIWLVY